MRCPLSPSHSHRFSCVRSPHSPRRAEADAARTVLQHPRRVRQAASQHDGRPVRLLLLPLLSGARARADRPVASPVSAALPAARRTAAATVAATVAARAATGPLAAPVATARRAALTARRARAATGSPSLASAKAPAGRCVFSLSLWFPLRLRTRKRRRGVCQREAEASHEQSSRRADRARRWCSSRRRLGGVRAWRRQRGASSQLAEDGDREAQMWSTCRLDSRFVSCWRRLKDSSLDCGWPGIAALVVVASSTSSLAARVEGLVARGAQASSLGGPGR